MKYFWSFCTLFITSIAFSQSDTLNDYQCYTNFSDAEKTEWTAFKNNWNFVYYQQLLKKYNIKKLNCKNCESFYADVYIEINNEGKISVIQIKTIKKCGTVSQEKTVIEDYTNSIKGYTFKTLKNKKYVTRLGNVLKC